MLNAENGEWTVNGQSKVPGPGPNGREDSWGFCQWNRTYFSSILDDPNFLDPYWQLNQCWEKYKSLTDPGTIFHGYYVRNEGKDQFYLTTLP